MHRKTVDGAHRSEACLLQHLQCRNPIIWSRLLRFQTGCCTVQTQGSLILEAWNIPCQILHHSALPTMFPRPPWVELPVAPPTSPIERIDRPSPAASLDSDVLQRILSMLPHHEHVVHALMTCRSWCAGGRCIALDRILAHPAADGLKILANLWRAEARSLWMEDGTSEESVAVVRLPTQRLGACRHAVGQNRTLWASFGARKHVLRAVRAFHGSIRLDSLTAREWRDV